MMSLERKAVRRRMTMALAILALIPVAPSAAQSMFGPGKFRIERSDDRFSADGTTTVIGHNNRVSSRSPAGGTFINGDGVYLEPMVVKQRDTGAIIRTGFIVRNEAQHDTLYGSPNSLGAPQAVSFLLDNGRLIRANVTDAEAGSRGPATFNSVGGYAAVAVHEAGIIAVAPSDMAALASATSVAVKIDGSERPVTFEAQDIAKTFLPHIAAFYLAQIRDFSN